VPRFDTGKVLRIIEEREGLVRAMVEVAGEERRATAFTRITGSVAEGDRVVLNVTGVELGLGTGGEDFILWNLEKTESETSEGGHILKLRYTPLQIDTVSAEAPESPHHDALREAESLEGMPVVACGLHSQIAPVVAVIKARNPRLRIAYVMTDGAALPIAHSDLVATLKDKGLLDATITCGHSFGGDLECVNVFSGLLAARVACEADVAVVSMGPGIVGTGTAFGHTGMEQGQVLSAAGVLQGLPVAALRISFADPRPRHRILSHHTLSALRMGALVRVTIAVPKLRPERLEVLLERLKSAGLDERHDIRVVDASSTIPTLDKFGLKVTTMGRSMSEDPDFFEAAGAAGLVATPNH
jgi:hypothetical protein